MAKRARSSVEIEGLKEFRRDLKALGPEINKELKQANFEVAKSVKTDAEILAAGLGGVLPKAAASLKAGKATTGATLTLGGSKAPWAFGAEFGSKRYKQFKPFRGALPSDAGKGNVGYFLFPTIRRDEDKIGELYLAKLMEISRKAFPN